MTWTDVEAAFAEAAELEPSARATFMERLATVDPDIAREVESLLAADAFAGEFLDRPLVSTEIRGQLEEQLGGDETLPPPESIGPYRVLSRLGAGGMSQVFLAERGDGEYRQEVAVKLIRTEVVSEELVRRFETERQILAQLTHPNIAALIDGGRTTEGLPFLVMEHVEGSRIDEYCDSHRLTVDERLDLFLDVCSAVQYAHRNLIVHRDIKVGNILVTDDGNPKLLDFGIAKLLSPELFPLEVERTATTLRPMTPYYASPEQIENGPITTATDVYSLGVLLYKMLTGTFPHDFDGLHTRGVEEKILEAKVRPMPQAVQASEGQLAEERRTTAKALTRRVGGDLDLIVAMALRKEPSRRFASVEQFAADVRAFLRDQPVRAHADSFGYRVRKFFARNRAATALGSLLIALVTTFALAASIQARRIAFERDQADRERARADQVIQFLQESFQIADPLGEGPQNPGALDVLRAGEERLGELETQPVVQADLLHVIGGVYLNMGHLPLGEQALGEAEALYTKLGDTRGAAESRAALGSVYLAQGKLALSESSLRTALEDYRTLGIVGPDLGAVQHKLAKVLMERGSPQLSESLLRQALDAQTEDDVSRSATLSDLAILLNESGRHEEAEPLFQEALEIRTRVFPRAHPLVSESQNNLAVFFGILGRLDESEALMQDTLDARVEAFGPIHSDVSEAMNNLAVLYQRSGRSEEALKMYRDATKVQIEATDEGHPRVSVFRKNLAGLLRDLGRYEEAEALLLTVIQRRVEQLGDGHISVALARSDYARVLYETQRASDCVEQAERASEVLRLEYEQGHWRLGEAESVWGLCLSAVDRPTEGEPLLRSGLAMLEEELGPEHPRTRDARVRLESGTGEPQSVTGDPPL